MGLDATRAPLGTLALGAALVALPALGLGACAAPRAAEPRLGGLTPSPPLSSALSPSRTSVPTGPSSSGVTATSPALSTGSPATTAAIPPPGTPFGASAPLTLVAAAPDRRWLAVCQATRDTTGDGAVEVVVGPQGSLSGDALDGFLLEGEGPGRRIEAFVGSDPTGRFVAFVEGGRLLLRDTTTRVDADLGARGADVRDDLAPFLSPRAGAFAPLGGRFLYLRRDGDRSSVVVRDLATGSETVLEPPSGELYRAEFDASGDWVVLRVAATDTNGNGKIEWPFPEAPAPRMRCTLPLPRFAVWERPHDEAAVFVARATGGAVTEAPGLVTPLGDALVLRDADDALVRVRGDGTRAPLVKKGCAARLLHVDAARGLLLVSCLGKKGLSDALLVGADFTKPLGVELSAVTGDHLQSGAPRLVALHPGTDAVLVDLDEKTALHLTPLDRIIATAGPRALVLRGHTLVIHDIAGPTETKLGDVTPLGHVQRAGSVVVVPPLVVDVATGELLGTTSARAMAVSTDGSVLVPDGRDADATHLAVGPLRWKRPRASGALSAPPAP